MKKFAILMIAFILISITKNSYCYNTSGCMLHVDNAYFNHNNLIKLTWKSDIIEYDYVTNQYRLRIEFNSVGFQGSQGICYVGAMIQNVAHNFNPDIVGSAFTNPQTITNYPALGIYFTSLHTDWLDNKHGVKCLNDNNIYPNFARVFENVDNLGGLGKNIYSRVNLIQPGINYPVSIKWIVSKKGTITNPLENLSKDIYGNWVSLSGTFVIWNFQVEINETVYDVADYYLPIENAEYLLSSDPLVLHQEHFGGAEMLLNSQKTKVRYSEISSYNGTDWFPLNKWKLTWRIDDGNNNQDNRFGWKTESGKYLVSVCGHEDDILNARREVNSTFDITSILSVSTDTLTIEALVNSTKTFDITSNISWTVASNQTWLTVSNLSGSENATITLTATANPNTTERVATVTVSGTGVTALTITVIQEAGATGISKIVSINIKVYPNPANNILFIDFSTKNLNVTVFDLSGTMLINKQITDKQIDISNLATGIYTIKIANDSGIVTQKFVKQ